MVYLNTKIHFSTLVVFAFIFRLMFVNVGFTSVFNLNQNHKLVKTHSSSNIKNRRKQADTSVQDPSVRYSVVDVFEENFDSSQKLEKANTPAVLAIFYSLFSRIISSIKQVIPFDYIKCELQPKRYLSLSVIRI